MPYGAFWVTVTGAPAWPSSDDEVGLTLGEGDVADALGEVVALPAVMVDGTETASGPRISSTCPAATEVLAVAVNPSKYPATLAALAAAPVPYSTWVEDPAVVLPTLPALNPAEVRACDISAASPDAAPPLSTSTVVLPGASDAALAVGWLLAGLG